MSAQADRNAHVLSASQRLDNLGRRAAVGGVFAMASQVLRIALQLATSVVMARLLTPADFGLIGMAATVTAFVALFTDLGLSTATIQSRDVDQDTTSALWLMNLGMGVAVMLAAIAAAPVAAHLFRDPRVFWVTVLIAAVIPVSALSSQHIALMQRSMRWATLQWTAIAAQFLSAVIGVVLAWHFSFGYWALVAQAWAAALSTLVLSWTVCRWRPTPVTTFRNIGPSLLFGLNLTGFTFVNYFHRQLDNVLIGWKWGSDALGHYSRAYTLLTLPISLISNPIASSIQPALARLQHEPTRWRSTMLLALGGLVLISSGVSAVLVVIARPAVSLLYGPGWSTAGQIFQVLAPSMFPVVTANAMGWIYISLGLTKRMMHWGLIGVPPYVIAFLIGVQFGAVGVATAYTVVNFMLFAPEIAFACSGTPVSARDVMRVVVPLTIAGCIVAALGLGLDRLFGGAIHSVLLRLALEGSGTLAGYSMVAIGLLRLDPSLAPLAARILESIRGTRRWIGGHFISMHEEP